MNKVPFKDKKRVSIFLSMGKERELKKKAIDANMTLSEYLEISGTITPVKKIKRANQND